MRYIKEYNQMDSNVWYYPVQEFLVESHGLSDLGWTKITSHQYNQYYQDRLVDDFNWGERRQLLNLLSGVVIAGVETKYFGADFRLVFGDDYLGGDDESVVYIKKGAYTFYEIFKTKDEWFYLVDMVKSYGREHRSYFRCDQFSGLIECLKERLKLLK